MACRARNARCTSLRPVGSARSSAGRSASSATRRVRRAVTGPAWHRPRRRDSAGAERRWGGVRDPTGSGRRRPSERGPAGEEHGLARPGAAGPAPAGAGQLPHALRRAGPDPVDGGQRHLPGPPDELRAAGELPRHRHRLPAGRVPARPLPVRSPGAGGARRLPPRVPGADRGRPARVDARRRARDARAAPLGQPVDRLPAHRLGARLSRPGGRPYVRPVRAAGGVPARRARQPGRHRAVRRGVVPPAAAAGLGGAGRRRVRAAARPPAAAGGRGRGGAGRPAARRAVAARRLLLVAVLQDPGGDLSGRQRQGRREQHAAPDRPPAEPARRLRPVLPLPLHVRRRPRRRADHRGRHRQRRRGRAQRGREAGGRGRDRSGAAAARQGPPPRAAVHGSQGRRARRRRAGVPGADEPPLRRHPAGPAGLGHDRDRAGGAAAGELPVHHRGADPGAIIAQAGRHVRDVQLLRGLARRPVREHDPGRVRRAALRPRRPVDRRPPGGGAEPAGGRQRRRLHHDLAAVDQPGASPPPTTGPSPTWPTARSRASTWRCWA